MNWIFLVWEGNRKEILNTFGVEGKLNGNIDFFYYYLRDGKGRVIMGIWSENWHKIGQNMDEMYRVSDDTWPQENFDKSQALYRHELDTWIFSKCLIWKRAWNLANFSCVQCRETPSNLTNLFSYSLCCTLFLLKRTRLGGGIPVLQIKIPFRIHLLW